VLAFDVDRPDLAGGVLGLRVARAVEADEADHLAGVVHCDLHQRLAVFDGVAPERAALAHGQGLGGFGDDAFIGGVGRVGMDGGDLFGIALHCRADLVAGHRSIGE
jgi:hypothetical protein